MSSRYGRVGGQRHANGRKQVSDCRLSETLCQMRGDLVDWLNGLDCEVLTNLGPWEAGGCVRSTLVVVVVVHVR